ncbi:class I SAM-dependent methyltransferase [Aquimixticola soesokkakensis]|uniref:class I SAM-dependent methyltransferase n=1 Tax=Aquimixticola soesokkakensis TaxID=1519096 RepID=UPI001F17AEC0|nr:methyltransferase [Aquimixticola soesokkakensis]
MLDAQPAAGDTPDRCVVFRPSPDADLAGLLPERCDVVHGFIPAIAALEARGWTVTAPSGRYRTAVVFADRSKLLTRAMIHDAVACADFVVVDGQKTDGIDSLSRDLRKRLGEGAIGPILSKSHGKALGITTAQIGDALADWALPADKQVADGFVTRAGIFSADGIDVASRLLVDALPEKLAGTVGDLGAGWGYLSRHILTRAGVKTLHLVEAEQAALACARRNVTDPRAQFHWADATGWRPPEKLDAVVMNPPFHTSRAADPALGQAFIRAGAGMLKPNGQLWLVANRQLPYETTLADLFRDVREVETSKGFKVLFAARPNTRPSQTA